MKLLEPIARILRLKRSPAISPPWRIQYVQQQSVTFPELVSNETHLVLQWAQAGQLAYWRCGVAVTRSPRDVPVLGIGQVLLAYIQVHGSRPIPRCPIRVFYAELFTDHLDCVDPCSDTGLAIPSSVAPKIATTTYPTEFGCPGAKSTARDLFRQYRACRRKETLDYVAQFGFDESNYGQCPF
jgi:hypothetical protein